MTAGMEAARAWLGAYGLSLPPSGRWHASALLALDGTIPLADLDDTLETRFRIEIYSEEWGVFFCHAGRVSWVRVTDVPFVHGRDDYRLLAAMPALADVGQLLRRVERDHGIEFRRGAALLRSDLAGAEATLRRWVSSL
jgi:hypothetical protein